MVTVTNTIETAHEDMIHDAQLNFFGTKLATCSSDCTIKVFEIINNTQKFVATLKGHEGPVWQIGWAHPSFGHILASCSYDKKVIIWSEINGKWEKSYEHALHKSSVNSICWAPYMLGLILACGSSDGDITILTSNNCDINMWDVQRIENAHDLGCNAVSWSPATPCSSLLTSSKDMSEVKYSKQFVSGGCDNIIKIWKENEGKWEEESILEGHTDWVRDVAWAPSLGIADQVIASCSQDKKVIIWSNDGTNKIWHSKIIHTFEDVIWHVSWSMTGSLLAVSGGDNTVSIWQEDVNGNWLCISDHMASSNENNES